VRQFFVRPDFRGLKIGEALLRAAAQSVRDEGLEALQMRPGRKTRDLCERVGLKAVGDVMELRPGGEG
jgi:GNAT superfamily N-acetyltransferase